MKVVEFVKEMKDWASRELLEVSGTGKCAEKTYTFKIGKADVITIRGGAIEKAAITHMVIKGIRIDKAPDSDLGVKYSTEDESIDTGVYQMEIFPENPYCPMGHFNTEWSRKGSGSYQYTVNLDLFPAVRIEEDLEIMRRSMDRVADKFGRDRAKMREGLDVHYNMKHWGFPLATNVGCKFITLEEGEVDIFIEAYCTFFDGYLEILRKRKDTPFGETEKRIKLERNGKWLEYLTLKDDAIKAAQAIGIPPEVIIGLSYPPSATF